MAALGSMRSRISSFTPMGPQPAPEMPELKPATPPTPAMRALGTSLMGRTSPRPPHFSVARTMTPTNTIMAATRRAMTSDGRATAKKGPTKAPAMPPRMSGVAMARLTLPSRWWAPTPERDDEQLQEERGGCREPSVDPQQEQSRDQHAAVDADGGGRQAGAHGHQAGQEDERALVGRGGHEGSHDDDDADDRQDHVGQEAPQGHARDAPPPGLPRTLARSALAGASPWPWPACLAHPPWRRRSRPRRPVPVVARSVHAPPRPRACDSGGGGWLGILRLT